MKNKKIIIFLACCILALAFILGVTGVVNLSQGITVKNSDRLIGVLITHGDDDQFTEPAGYHYPATRKEKRSTIEVDGEEQPYAEVEYDFEGINGTPFMLLDIQPESGVNTSTTVADDTIANVQISHSTTDDTAIDNALRGTIYLTPEAENLMFTLNPVYQTADGDVYAMAGTPVSTSNCSATTGSRSQDLSWTEGLKTFTRSMRVEVRMEYIKKPVKISLYQYNASHELIHTDEYAPDLVPDEIIPLPDAEYVVIETETDGGEPVWEIRGKDDGSFSTCLSEKDGICVMKGHEIVWPE